LPTAFGLTPGGSTNLHINNTQNITINNKTTQITNKTTQITNLEECWPCFKGMIQEPKLLLKSEKRIDLKTGKTNRMGHMEDREGDSAMKTPVFSAFILSIHPLC
jgi:hypothetical protein